MKGDASGDAALLLRLRGRHIRTKLSQGFRLAGSDLDEDRTLSERAYQLYAAFLLAAIAFLLWLFLLDTAARAGDALGAQTTARLRALLESVPLCAFPFFLIRHLRHCPIKMGAADIQWLVSRLDPAAWVLAGLAAHIPAMLAEGALLGFAAATLLHEEDPAAAALSFACGIAVSDAAAWLAGLSPHLRARRHRHALGLDVASLAEANALSAELESLRPLAHTSPAAIGEARRRHALARRKPHLSLPDLPGRRFFVARAALSHIRQREGLLDLAVWSAGVVPFGSLLLASGTPDIGALLSWIMAGACLLPRAKEIARVFADDRRVGAVLAVSAYPAHELFLLESLPAAAFAASLSLAAILAAALSGIVSASLPAAILLSLAQTSSLVFAQGIGLAAGPSARLLSFEVLATGYMAAISLLACAGIIHAVLGACLYAALLAATCRALLA